MIKRDPVPALLVVGLLDIDRQWLTPPPYVGHLLSLSELFCDIGSATSSNQPNHLTGHRRFLRLTLPWAVILVAAVI